MGIKDKFREIVIVPAFIQQALAGLFNGASGRFKLEGAGYHGLGTVRETEHQKNPHPVRDCLYCEKPTSHSQPFCSGDHKIAWEALNPGNGRYVNEEWCFVAPGRLAHFNWTIDIVSYFTSKLGYKKTYRLESPEYKTVGNFDCLIDAQRAASRHLRLTES